MLKFIMDLENQKWICSGEPDSPNDVEAHFYLDMIPGKTAFKNFDFYFTIIDPEDTEYGHVIVQAESEEEVLKRGDPLNTETSFPYLCNKHFMSNLFAGKTYQLKLFFKNRRKYVEDFYSFTMPKPNKPHANWIWDNVLCQWIPPIPIPQPIWDQESQKWILP